MKRRAFFKWTLTGTALPIVQSHAGAQTLVSELIAVRINPTTVFGGTASAGKVFLSGPAPAGGLPVSLTSSKSTAAQVTSSVTVQAGATTATFTVSTSSVAADTVVGIIASHNLVKRTAALMVRRSAAVTALSSVSVSPATVLGGASSIGTVTLSGSAPADGVVVSLASSNTAATQVPATVTVLAGATATAFSVATSPVASDTPVTITATHNTVTRTATLTVTAAAVAALSSVSVSPASVAGGASSTGTVTLSGSAPAGGAAVSLTSDNVAAAQVPASVTVAAGATTAAFEVTTSPVATDTSITITATLNNLTRNAALTVMAPSTGLNPVFHISQIPDNALTGGNHHMGVDALIALMGGNGLKFYRSGQTGIERGPDGLIAADDVVLLKVNAQWKYRGCTNSDLVRGLVQRILEHPDVFRGEVVIFDNGQGHGSLRCDNTQLYDNAEVHANAQNESHSFQWLVDSLFRDSRVSAFLLDPIGRTFISAADHVTNGYRYYENVSYPCFTTAGGRRVELREGIWNGSSHISNLKMINVQVLKHHDVGGSEITASLKNVYGILSMADGQSSFRHYAGLGETCGKMMVSVHTPVLNIVDAIWVSHSSLIGYPESTTVRANQIVASQDPVALDYWTAKYILYPINNHYRHHPDFSGIDTWLTGARDLINGRGGFDQAARGIQVGTVTKAESEIVLVETVP